MTVDLAALAVVLAVAGFVLGSDWSATVEITGAGRQWRVTARGQIGRFGVSGTWETASPTAPSRAGIAFDPKLVAEGIVAFRIYRRALEDLWRHLRFDQVEVAATIGLGSPARTAWAVGAATGALGWWLQARVAPRAGDPPKFRVEPDWTRSTMEGRIRSRIRIRGWALAGVAWRAIRYGMKISDIGGRVRAWNRMRSRFMPGSTQSKA